VPLSYCFTAIPLSVSHDDDHGVTL
jgi:hypothetical protein